MPHCNLLIDSMQPEPETHTIALPSRPKLSKMIKKFEEPIITNYYPINILNTNKKIYQFEIVFSPEIPKDSRGLIRKTFNAIGPAAREKIGPFILKGTMVWATKASESFTIQTKFTDDSLKGKVEHQFDVTFKKTAEFRLDQLEADPKLAQKVLQVLNSQLKKKMSSLEGMKQIGFNSKYYDIKKEFTVKDSYLKVLRGFMTTIHLIEGQPCVLIDVSNRVLRKQNFDMTLKFAKDNKKDYIGRSVIASYGNYRIYKIEGFAEKLTPLSEFQVDKGKKITYSEYFKSRYGIQVTNKNQILIESSVKKHRIVKEGEVVEQIQKIYLVPELVNLTGIEDSERKDRRLMKDISEFTKMQPQDRNKQVQSLLQKLKKPGNDGELFEIQPHEKTVQGYLLPQPNFKVQDKTIRPEGGKLNIRARLLSPMKLDYWSLVYTSLGQRDDESADRFVEILQKAGKEYGIEVSKPSFITSKKRGYTNFLDAIRSIKEIQNQQIIVTLLNEKSEVNYYSDLKKQFFLKYRVSHQNVLKSSVHSKNAMSVASKILLQINAKLGKPLWRVPCSHPDLQNKRIMIGGVAFDNKLVRGKKSAAFVGTTNLNLTRYYSDYKLLENMKEQRITCLEEMSLNWARTFCKNVGKVPEYIVVFRESVGEGSIDNVINQEISALQKSIRVLGEKMKEPNYNPGVAFILVNRKINQRIFMSNRKSHAIVNPESGSVVGSSMSRGGRFEYFVVPQFVNSGTATPTSYNVIFNTTDLSEDAFYFLTFEQCFNYYNWQGAVRVPAPLMYAGKLATLVGEHLQEMPKPSKKEEKKKQDKKEKYEDEEDENAELERRLYFL